MLGLRDTGGGPDVSIVWTGRLGCGTVRRMHVRRNKKGKKSSSSSVSVPGNLPVRPDVKLRCDDSTRDLSPTHSQMSRLSGLELSPRDYSSVDKAWIKWDCSPSQGHRYEAWIEPTLCYSLIIGKYGQIVPVLRRLAMVRNIPLGLTRSLTMMTGADR